MRLTPADVHNVAFKKPSIGKRGYDEDEVDAFLDLVEAELARLIEENNDLTQRVAALQNDLSAAQNNQGQAVAQAPAPVLEKQPEAAPEPAPQPVVQAPPPAPEPVVAQAPVQQGPADHHLQAARLLGLAQSTADQLTSDAAAEAEQTRTQARQESEQLLTHARTESDRMLNEAHAESERLVTDAKNESERLVTEAQAEATKTVNDARQKSEQMVGDATSKAEALERDSRVRSDAMDREAQSKYNTVIGQLTEHRSTLEKKIDDLHTYEHEYRSRLRGWITDQLSQLEDRENGTAAAPTEQQPADQHN